MEERARNSVAFLRMRAFAALALAMLVLIGFSRLAFVETTVENGRPEIKTVRKTTGGGEVDWQTLSQDALSASSSALSDPDGLGNIDGNVSRALLDGYLALAEEGKLEEGGEELANAIAQTLRASVSYEEYTEDSLRVVDASPEAAKEYKRALEVAFEPLLANTEYELALFAQYLDSQDMRYRAELTEAAARYRSSIERAAQISVPRDAVDRHLTLLNALSEYESVIAAMALQADNPFASAALLSTYQKSETRMIEAFASIGAYHLSKRT